MSDDKVVACCARVQKGSDRWRTRYKQCTRSGTVERGGQWYCGQHDPQVVADRLKKSIDHLMADIEENARRQRLANAAPDLLEALKGVLRVADRATVEFDAARDAITKAEGSDT